MILQKLLDERVVLLADGATGTNLFAMGLVSGDAPETWNLEYPARVAALHRSFTDAGSDIILTNTFGGNARRLRLHHAQGQAREINEEAALIAREVADTAGRPVIVAGSMGPTGDLFAPLGELTYDEAVAAFAEQAEGLKAGGVDVLWIETMSAADEIKAAAEAAASTGLPFTFTASFDTAGRTMMGLAPKDLPALADDMAEKPVAVGGNCGVGAPDLLAAILDMSEAHPAAILIAKGNCGIPEFHGKHIHYSGTPELMARYAQLAVDAGAHIVGGCCGTSPVHVKAMRAALDGHEKGERPALETIIEEIGPMVMKTAAESGTPRERRGRRRG